MKDKQVYFGWGITLMYYDENAGNSNFVRSTNSSFSRRTGFRGHIGKLPMDEKERIMSLLEQHATKLVKANVPEGSFVSGDAVRTADGVESSDLNSYLWQSQIKDWMIKNSDAFRFEQKTRQKKDGTRAVWQITNHGLFSTAGGNLNLPSEFGSIPSNFELFLEVQFEKPTGYCVSCE